MFIKVPPNQTINTDYIEYMYTYAYENTFLIRFYMISKKEIQFNFKSQEELDIFHENILLELGAKELSKEKSLTIT